MNYLTYIQKNYQDTTDLIIKQLKGLYIIYLETLADQNKINDYILKIIPTHHIPSDIKKLIPSPNIKDINSTNDLELYLNTGFTIIINNKQTIAIETKTDLTRSIDTPTTEPTIFGPKDSLTENFQTNLGLIKRRIRSPHLKNKNKTIGRLTKSLISTLYLDNVAKSDIVEKVENHLNTIDVDGFNDIGELKEFLTNENRNVFPAFKITERPDVIARALLNGKIVILMDTSPYALIIPSFLADFINPIDDNYSKSININFLKILRFICFFLAIITPAFYVAITTYNQETIPSSLLIKFQSQRMGVPFPAIVECLITLITCEILRESDIRFPTTYGSAISILGALILGEAAVSAGIVSPIIIIVVALTFISSLIFTDLEIINGIREWRFFFLLLCCFYGLYGVGLGFVFLIVNLIDYEVYNTPYFYPLAPFDLTYIKETLFKMHNKKRSKLLSKNIIKED